MKKKLLFAGLAIFTMTSMTGCGTSSSLSAVSSSSVEATAENTDSADHSAESNGQTGATETAGSQADDSQTEDSLTTTRDMLDEEEMFTDKDQDSSYDESSATTITLSKDSATVDGDGATAEGGQVTISSEGTYIISGTLEEGQILVDADDKDKVQIVLDGCHMTNPKNACILVENADKVFITLAKGSDNSLADGGQEYEQENEDDTVDGVIYSKSDLTLNGSGSLEITAGYKHGIVGKDDLKVTGGTYQIKAAGKGMVGKDSVRISDGDFTIDAEDDAIHTSNDEDEGKGFVYIAGGKFDIQSGDDGIHAETCLLITDGDISITESNEGLEGATVDIEGGNIDIVSSDDGINAAYGSSEQSGGMQGNMGNRSDETGSGSGNMTPPQMPSGENQGDFTPPQGDGQNSQGNSSSGKTDTGRDDTKSGKTDAGTGNTKSGQVASAGADTTAVTENSDDGTAATVVMGNSGDDAGLADNVMTGHGGFGGGMGMDTQSDAYICISGGNVTVNADGDGIDSNGMVYLNGGTVRVEGPTNSGNAALDYGTGCQVNGGDIIIVGSTGMAEAPDDDSSQYTIMENLDSVAAAGTKFTLCDETGKEIFSYTPDKDYQSIILSSDQLEEGTYTLTAGDQTETITVENTVTSNGNGGMSGGGRAGNL